MGGTDDDVTVGEIVRRLRRIEEAMRGVVTRDHLDEVIAHRREDSARVSDAIRAEIASVRSGLEVLQGWATWGIRIVLGAVIAALSALVITVR